MSFVEVLPQILEPFKGVKGVALEEYFTSGHRTCQGCESALVMKLMIKAAGERGWLDADAAMMESLIAFKRAGADAVLSYAALWAAERLRAGG